MNISELVVIAYLVLSSFIEYAAVALLHTQEHYYTFLPLRTASGGAYIAKQTCFNQGVLLSPNMISPVK